MSSRQSSRHTQKSRENLAPLFLALVRSPLSVGMRARSRGFPKPRKRLTVRLSPSAQTPGLLPALLCPRLSSGYRIRENGNKAPFLLFKMLGFSYGCCCC